MKGGGGGGGKIRRDSRRVGRGLEEDSWLRDGVGDGLEEGSG